MRTSSDPSSIGERTVPLTRIFICPRLTCINMACSTRTPLRYQPTIDAECNFRPDCLKHLFFPHTLSVSEREDTLKALQGSQPWSLYGTRYHFSLGTSSWLLRTSHMSTYQTNSARSRKGEGFPNNSLIRPGIIPKCSISLVLER